MIKITPIMRVIRQANILSREEEEYGKIRDSVIEAYLSGDNYVDCWSWTWRKYKKRLIADFPDLKLRHKQDDMSGDYIKIKERK